MKKILSNLLIIIIILNSLLIIFLKIVKKEEPSSPFGISLFQISSNSMAPTFYKDDFIIIKKEEDYNIGEIITYKINNNCLVTHRIIEKYKNVFITKGDANNIKDEEEIPREAVVGKVVYIINIYRDRM